MPSGSRRLGRAFEGVPGVRFVQGHRVRALTALDLQAGREVEEQIEDRHGTGQELQLQFQESCGLALTFRIRLYPGRPFVLMRICVTNVGPHVVRLRHFFVRTEPGGLTMTAPPTAFYANGWQSNSATGLLPSGGAGPTGAGRRLGGPSLHSVESRHALVPAAGPHWSETVGAIVTSRRRYRGHPVVWLTSSDRSGLTAPHISRRFCRRNSMTCRWRWAEARHSEWFYLEWVPLRILTRFPSTRMRWHVRWAWR